MFCSIFYQQVLRKKHAVPQFMIYFIPTKLVSLVQVVKLVGKYTVPYISLGIVFVGVLSFNGFGSREIHHH